MNDPLDAISTAIGCAALALAALWGYFRWLMSRASEDDDV